MLSDNVLSRVARSPFFPVILLAQATYLSITSPSWATGVFFGVASVGVALSAINWYGDKMLAKARRARKEN